MFMESQRKHNSFVTELKSNLNSRGQQSNEHNTIYAFSNSAQILVVVDTMGDKNL